MQHVITVEGRSLIRIFLAGATKDAALYEMSDEQAQKKKLSLDLVLSKRMITFETMSRSSWTSQANEFEFSRSKILK